MGLSRRERKLQKKKKAKKQVEVEETVEEAPNETKKNIISDIYENNYKKLLVIPFAVLLIAIIIIGIQLANTGDIVNKGITLKGGLTMTITTEADIDPIALESYIRSVHPNSEVDVRKLTNLGRQVGVIIETSDINEDDLISTLTAKITNLEGNYSIESTGPSLGTSFFKQTLIAIIITFIFMGLTVFLYFKTFIPSIAVILAAFSDIVITMAVINILGIKVSTAGIAAFLMLIGYSVDTDILLSTRVLKEKAGTVYERTIGAMKTGLTMNFTTMAAVIISLIISESEVITQIMTILLIGLLADLINTWLQNAGILRWYMAKQGKH